MFVFIAKSLDLKAKVNQDRNRILFYKNTLLKAMVNWNETNSKNYNQTKDN